MSGLPWWFLAMFVLGINFAIWGTIGVIRLAESGTARIKRRRARAPAYSPPKRATRQTRGGRGSRAPARSAAKRITLPARPGVPNSKPITRRIKLSVKDVAVLMPAHNEAAVLGASLDAITKLVAPRNVHVVSDGSTDDTPEIARRAGVRVHETERNVGKAGALREAIERFKLIRRYPVVLLLDADTRVDPDYFAEALPLFDTPEVVAVAGCVRTARDRHLGLVGNILVGHRERIYAMGQRVLKFGQTYLRANATHIVPGFASMYRTEVLRHIEVDPPGLVIEDFNMTFEVYQKDLGKVAFTLSAVAVTQDPDRFHDYVKQTRRWAIGLWQTVRRHPPRKNLFTFMLALLLLELIISSAIFLVLPLAAAVLILPDVAGNITLTWPLFSAVHADVAAHMTLSAIVFGVLVPDYAMTCLVAVLDRRPRLLLIGLCFPAMRVIDAALALSAVPAGWFVRSNGIWKSPARRPVQSAPAPEAATAGVPPPGPAARELQQETTVPVPEESPTPANYLGERGHASG